MKRKKIAVALAVGLTLGTTFAAPVTASVAEAANESVMKLKSPAETYAAQGKKLFDEGKFTEAGEAYENAAKEAKSNDEYWFLCGLSYFRAESYKTASEPLKKAIKLKSNEGLYNYFYGLSLWNWARAVRSGKSSSTFSGTDDLMDKGDQYVKRAAELMPDDVNVQMAAGTIAENYANYLARSGGYRSYINEEYQRAYQHFRRAAELDPSKGENQTRFANEHSEYGFQPYKPATPPAPQPTPDLPDSPPSSDLRSLTYTPRQSQTATLAYSAYDWGNLSEVYRNPYTDGCEYVVITSFERKEGGRSFSHYRDSFDYIPDDPDDPGAGGEFLFTGGYTRADDLNQYYMRARVEGDALRVEWLMGNRQNGPQRNTGVAYPEDTYRLQPITDAMYDIAFFDVANMSYRFVSTRGISSDKKSCLSDDYASAIAVMFAFLDFLNEGSTADAIVEPPPGITLPNHGGLKQPELYREPGLTF